MTKKTEWTCKCGKKSTGAYCRACGRTRLSAPVQTEIEGMPEMDECGRAGKELFDVLADIEKMNKVKNDKTEALIQALNKSRRASIKIESKVFTLKHLEEDFVLKITKS